MNITHKWQLYHWFWYRFWYDKKRERKGWFRGKEVVYTHVQEFMEEKSFFPERPLFRYASALEYQARSFLKLSHDNLW